MRRTGSGSGFGYRSDGGFGEKLRLRAYLTFRLPNKQIQKNRGIAINKSLGKSKTSPTQKAGELEGREPLDRACQTAVQTVALGKNCDDVRTED